MIFTDPKSTESFENIESHKERNFYCKVFAGYFFNELISEPNSRFKAFLLLLKSKVNDIDFFFKSEETDEKHAIKLLQTFNIDESHVSFDFHGDQLTKRWDGDDGELADILIIGRKAVISIEVKYLTNWNFTKDVMLNQIRIAKYGELVGRKAIQVLLIKKSKWENARKKENHSNSQFALLKAESGKLKLPMIVITWEDIMEITGNEKVIRYLEHQLKDVNNTIMNREEFHEFYLNYLNSLKQKLSDREELIYRVRDYSAQGKETGNPRKVFDIKDNVLHIEELSRRNIISKCTEEELFVIYEHFEEDIEKLKHAKPRKEKLLADFHNFIEFKRPILIDMLGG
ncbi:MAG: hypothetical protein K0B37_07175 [Bacteroidales bacterium]|nr:hypothetical protein [Bacteroidales bacterium]